jgi:hypothetical protein
MGAHPVASPKAYLCECGKKWTLRSKAAAKATSFTCDCGRTIVVRHGMVFSIGKPNTKGV